MPNDRSLAESQSESGRTTEGVISPPAERRRRYLAMSLGLFVVVRLVVLAVGLAFSPAASDGPWYGALLHWDGAHYARIAREGYPHVGSRVPETAAFFPAYPLLGRAVPLVSERAGLLIVSNLSALVAAAVVFLLARELWDERAGMWAVVLLSVYPGSMFLSVAYAESLLLLEVAVVLWLLHRRWWLWAVAVAVVSGATRPNGVLLAGVIAAAIGMHLNARPSRRVVLAVTAGLVSLAGLVGHLGYLGVHYGKVDAYAQAQSHWPRSQDSHPVLRAVTLEPLWDKAYRPIRTINDGAAEMLRPKTWPGPVVLSMLVVSVWALVRPGKLPRWWLLIPLGTFLLAYARDPVNGKIAESARYLTVSVPAFLWIGRTVADGPARRRWIATGVACAMLAIQCMYIAGFVRWEYAG